MSDEETPSTEQPTSDEETPSAPQTPSVEEPGAPAPASTPDPVAETPCPPRAGASLPWWPFLVYLTLWAGLVGASVYLLAGPDAIQFPLENPVYPVLLLAAVALTATGPLLAILVGAVAWARAEPGCRSGLIITALVRGASTTLFGVLAWWAALVIIDHIRLGSIG